jgi:hypothetical protein
MNIFGNDTKKEVKFEEYFLPFDPEPFVFFAYT